MILVPVPAAVPPQEPVNHSQLAPVPSVPPVTVSVLFVPKQVLLLDIVIPVGATELLPTVTASCLAELVPQELVAVTLIVPFWPVVPVVTLIEFVVEVPDHPPGKVHV